MAIHRGGAVHVLDAERALLHLLEAERQRAVDEAAADHLAREVERRAIPSQQLLLTLTAGTPVSPSSYSARCAAGRVPVAVADERLLDLVVGDAGVGERLLAGLAAHVGIVPLAGARLLELGHADTDDKHLATHAALSLLRSSRGRSPPVRGRRVEALRTVATSPARAALGRGDRPIGSCHASHPGRGRAAQLRRRRPRRQRARILEAYDRAAAVDADLVAFPELAITGYPPEDLLLRPAFIEAARRPRPSTRSRPDGLPPLGGRATSRLSTRQLYNAAARRAHGRGAGIYRKHQLPNYGVFDEQRYFTPGDDRLPSFAIAGVAGRASPSARTPGSPTGPIADAGAGGRRA